MTPVLRFEIESDSDATRIASVACALGYRAVRVVETTEHALAWGLTEMARRFSLTTWETEFVAAWIRQWDRRPAVCVFGQETILHKLSGLEPALVLSGIVESKKNKQQETAE